MSLQFDFRNFSQEDLSSLLKSNSELVTIPISTRARANSNCNVIDESNQPFSKTVMSPKRRFHSMDDIFDSSVRERVMRPIGTMSDCVPSPDSDSSYASSSASGSNSSESSSPTCEISLLERLIRTHPVWFLPSLQRSGALHLLQGRDVGNFIVRSSTQPRTMAVSVKLPGNHVEHYLLKANGNKISLENSSHTFDTVHQLVAHYCETSDEIPVCLRVPFSIAEATSRQQLASLALLGQEFWSISGSCTNKDSPVDGDIINQLSPPSLGSQSSSNHSLTEILKGKPTRPTTLELGMSRSTGGAASSGATPNPPPVPVRWSRSALLTPLSQPSSVQSTPSEMQSTVSEKSGRPGRKKKRPSGGNKAESIHYKDTEILALEVFKGTKTVYDDKASDYEDIWSPQYFERSRTPKLSTFKPDLIPSSISPEEPEHTVHSRNSNKPIQHAPVGITQEDFSVFNMNIQNHRLSFNGQKVNLRANDNLSKSQNNVDQGANRKSNGVYSEPLDSITLRRNLENRPSTEANVNVRWSQPTLPFLKLDFTTAEESQSSKENCQHAAGSGRGKPQLGTEVYAMKTPSRDMSKNLNTCQQAINTTRSSYSHADVSSSNKYSDQLMPCRSSATSKSNRKGVTCASVDNLCSFGFKKPKTKLRVSSREDVNFNPEFVGQVVETTNDEGITSNTTPSSEDVAGVPELTAAETPNRSWGLDNSWELVMWQKEEEERKKENSAKFPIFPSPPRSPKLHKAPPSESSHTENSLGSSVNNGSTGHEAFNSLRRRFSCYDNLEKSKAETNADEESDSDEDKISPPWDSTKWEHLMRIISESTQQLDLVNSVGQNPYGQIGSPLRENGAANSSENPNQASTDPLRVSRILDLGGNLDKAWKAVAAVVRNLAIKDDGVFGPTLKSFVSCTIAAKIQDPYKVMRNVRQFISGIKNYMVGVNSESEELRKEIKRQTETLSGSEFLNIDAILEEVLVDLVVAPLHIHIRGLIEAYSAKNAEPIQLPSEADIMEARSGKDALFSKLSIIYSGFEESISPMKKLDKWNEFVCLVQEMDHYSTDSFLPLLSESLGCVCTDRLPSHVDYMIGLLPPSLAEQNNYSLSLLQSAVSSLKINTDPRKTSRSVSSVRVLIPDERNGTLIRKMVPVRDSTTSKDVAKIVASKLGITNPSDYVLVTVKNGEETICPESELVYNCMDANGTALAYKRLDAKIGWPQKIS